MAIDVLDILRAKNMSPQEFHFDTINIPHLYNYLTPQDIEGLHNIATSIKLQNNIKKKYELIDMIMRNRGFKRFAAGTNRVVYRFLEDDRFLAKIAVDKVGLKDNPNEFNNQHLLKPFVTKMFYVSNCGTVGLSERVIPIKNKMEFTDIAPDVFDILMFKILGEYVVQDVGTKFFMNWGIRPGFGPVLLDYPYVYKLDGNKLFCSVKDPITNKVCNGEIDFDDGFNSLVCTKCGHMYMARDLKENHSNNKIIIKGGTQFMVRTIVKIDDKIVHDSGACTTEYIHPEDKKQTKEPKNHSNKFAVTVKLNDRIVYTGSEKQMNHVIQENYDNGSEMESTDSEINTEVQDTPINTDIINPCDDDIETENPTDTIDNAETDTSSNADNSEDIVSTVPDSDEESYYTERFEHSTPYTKPRVRAVSKGGGISCRYGNRDKDIARRRNRDRRFD